MTYDEWKATAPDESHRFENEMEARELAMWRGWSSYWDVRYAELAESPVSDIDAAYKATIAKIAQSEPWLLARYDNSLRALTDKFATEYLAWLEEGGS